MAKHKKILEAPQGYYTAFPHDLLDSVAFMGASHTARSLLCELLRQHNARNNGHLHLASTWLKKRGWGWFLALGSYAVEAFPIIWRNWTEPEVILGFSKVLSLHFNNG